MEISAVFKRPFDEQVAFFRGKMGNLIPTEKWTDVWKSAHDTGFMVAGAAKADLLADFAGAVDRAISEGTGIGKFREEFDAIVKKHGWSYRGEYNWRTRTIYRTNMSTSYSAGRLVQLKEDGYPYWVYRHSDSVARPRPLHVSWDGLTIPANDPWWQTHYPPNGWGCQCYVIGARNDRMAKRLGGRMAKAPDDGVSADGTPNGIDKGWDYQPGATAVERVRKALLGLAEALPAKIAAGLKKDLDIVPDGSNIQSVDAAITQASPTSTEMTMTDIHVADRVTGAGRLVVKTSPNGRQINATLDGIDIGDLQFGAAHGVPKQYADKYSHMLVSRKGNILLTPDEAKIILQARVNAVKELERAAEAFSKTLRGQRAALVEAEYNSYDASAFPGSAQWQKNKKAADALAKFDAEHPDLVAELAAEAEAKRKAAFDGMSDFVKNGS